MAIREYAALQYPELFMFHVPNEGRRSLFERYKNKVVGVVPGAPDFVLVAPGGKVAFMEVKTQKGRLTENQKTVIKQLQNNGAAAGVVFGFDEARDLVDRLMSS